VQARMNATGALIFRSKGFQIKATHGRQIKVAHVPPHANYLQSEGSGASGGFSADCKYLA